MNHWAINLGANDGATSDPVVELYHNGWHGVAVELESQFCDRLTQNLDSAHVAIHCPVPATPLNIQTLLQGVPVDMDYLKIDIDSYDCDVLASIMNAGYRPKVIQMETGTIPPPVRFASHYHDSYSRPHAQIYQAFGCSLSYVDDLLSQFGPHKYELIEASLDSIWVRSDILKTSSSHITSTDAFQPLEAFRSPLTAYVNGFWRYPWRRELHVWEIGTEHWFQLEKDEDRMIAIEEHMTCVESCFHSKYAPFDYTLQLGPMNGPFKGSNPETDYLKLDQKDQEEEEEDDDDVEGMSRSHMDPDDVGAFSD
eukprot:CAMPEP_0114349996 /NCGR_PEP_ID=MMETSP0101-20121206/15984_1 /TAXON_ID=38822 ORGANISM="Pteridomonas danica, Strain PT" /NCGR_SAMPLE_ID=MMETSP0101 /ASSEMBLY_ACC=CAM_ASM_000211 /LENGTH=309 /DNA_ID=CAMNT_0001488915 /DNA_START=95 /DNA_END=1024 /DNA_ORIENTATION=+